MSNIVPTFDTRPNVLEHVSLNLRQRRQAAGFSQVALAEAAGVSRRMIVALEGGDVNVSLATLDRIAAALEVSFAQLVQAPHRSVTRIDGLAWMGEDPASRATLLASVDARQQVELWQWSLAPGERYVSEADAPGWHEMLYVMEGRLRLELPSEQREIGRGDYLVFPSDQPYTYVNPGPSPLRFIRNVVS